MTDETELLQNVLNRLRPTPTARRATVRRLTVGERLLLVELDTVTVGRVAGAAHRPPGDSCNDVEGMDGLALAEWAISSPTGTVAKAAGIAALNALSAPEMNWRVGDPMAAIDGADVVGTIGLFQPALKNFDAREVRVVEREPVEEVDSPPGVSVSMFGTDEYEKAIESVEILFVTGSSLIYGGIDTYLHAAETVPTVVLIGATASFLPGPAFEAGVTMLAGAQVTDADSVRRGVRAGACGTDLHDSGLDKVYVAADYSLPGLDMRR